MEQQKKILEDSRKPRREQDRLKQATYSEEILVDTDLVGLIIGKAGQAVKDVQNRYNVKIQVGSENVDDGDKRRIIIQAQRSNDLQEAVDEVYLQRLYIPVEDENVKYVCGYNDENLNYFQKKAGVISLTLDRNRETGKPQLVAIGRPSKL